MWENVYEGTRTQKQTTNPNIMQSNVLQMASIVGNSAIIQCMLNEPSKAKRFSSGIMAITDKDFRDKHMGGDENKSKFETQLSEDQVNAVYTAWKAMGYKKKADPFFIDKEFFIYGGQVYGVNKQNQICHYEDIKADHKKCWEGVPPAAQPAVPPAAQPAVPPAAQPAVPPAAQPVVLPAWGPKGFKPKPGTFGEKPWTERLV